MEASFSIPLREPPSFLSTISMVGDDTTRIVHSLTQAERKSPSRYEPARAMFLSVLEGKLSYDATLTQARRLADKVERECALQILHASKSFLEKERPAPITPLPNSYYTLPNKLPLLVRPLWVRNFSQPRLLVMHFWRSPLTQRQLSAAATIIQSVIADNFPSYTGCEIDFLATPFVETRNSRDFQRNGWQRLRPLNEVELGRFWKQFSLAWDIYKKREPRIIRRKRKDDLFG